SWSLPPQIQGRFCRWMFPADHDHVVIVEWVRFAVIVKYVREILTGDAQHIGQVVVSSSHDNFAGPVIIKPPGTVSSGHAKVSVFADNGLHPLILAHVQAIMLGHAPIVFKRLLPRGLMVRGT